MFNKKQTVSHLIHLAFKQPMQDGHLAMRMLDTCTFSVPTFQSCGWGSQGNRITQIVKSGSMIQNKLPMTVQDSVARVVFLEKPGVPPLKSPKILKRRTRPHLRDHLQGGTILLHGLHSHRNILFQGAGSPPQQISWTKFQLPQIFKNVPR